MSILDEPNTLKDPDSLRLLREFVNERCDDIGLQERADWQEVLSRAESGELCPTKLCNYLFTIKY
jgi:hypothetical protein